VGLADIIMIGIEAFIAIIVISILISGIRILREWERAPY
jgi:hypothetical protein